MAGGNPNVQFTPFLTFAVGAGSAVSRATNYNSFDIGAESAAVEDGTFGSEISTSRPGLASIKIGSMLRPDADGVHEGELWGALKSRTACTYVFRRTTAAKSTTNAEYTVTGFVMSSPPSSAERGGLIGGNFTFQPNYLKRDDGTTVLEW